MSDLDPDPIEDILDNPELFNLDDLFNQIMSERTGEWDGSDDEPWHSMDLVADTWGEDYEEEKCSQ